MTELYFLIVNYNSSDLIIRLIKSIVDLNDNQAKIVIINNSPADQGIPALQSHQIMVIEAQKNLGFGKACNLGLDWIYQHHKQAIVWLINPDTYFDPAVMQSPIKSAIALLKNHAQISIWGTTVYNSAGEITSAGGTFIPKSAALEIIAYLPESSSQDYYATDWVSGCSLLINLANFSEAPQFCDRFFLYYEDLDFCLHYSQQGHQIAVTNLLPVVHETSSITNRNTWQKYRHITQSYLIYIEKYGSLKIFILTNLRMLLNTLRLIIFKPQQGLGKAIGIYEYWQMRIFKS